MVEDLVDLQNGEQEQRSLVEVTMKSLRNLERQCGKRGLHELRERCYDPDFKLSGTVERYLKSVSLIAEDGSVHDSIKNVVFSGIEGIGAGLGIGLIWPICGEDGPEASGLKI